MNYLGYMYAENNVNLKEAKKMGFTSASFNIICPLPGSRIYDKYKDILSFEDVELRKSSIPHPEISKQEMEKLVDGLNKKFNSSLIYRNPVKFMKKYAAAVIRKPSFDFVKKLFSRQ